MRIPAIALLFVVALPLCATTITHPLQEEAGVSIIEVPVYVTSHDGKPVSDLKAENFTLYEDGKKKDLVFAQLMGTGSVGSLPNGIVESRGHFILFFDLTFNQLGGLKRARDAAMQFINEQLPPGESVSVFSFALTDGVKMLLNFTTDRHKVLEAVDSLSFTKARDFLADSAGLVPKPNFLQEPNSSNLAQSMALEDENSLVIRMGIKQMDTMAYRSLVKEYLTQVRDFARSLDVLDGRKYVIFFSAGFDTKVIGGQKGIGYTLTGRAPCPVMPCDSASMTRLPNGGIGNHGSGGYGY